MKSKKYFNRIFAVLSALCALVALLLAIFFYANSVNTAKKEFATEKQTETASACAKTEYMAELFEKSAVAAANVLNYADVQTAANEAKKLCPQGKIYIANENSVIYKEEDAENLSRSVEEKLISQKSDKKVFSFVSSGMEYVAFSSRVVSNNSKVFVMRVFEESEFLNETGSLADALMFVSDDSVMYIGYEKYCADLKTRVNETGAANVFSNVKNGEFKGKNIVYIPAEIKNANSLSAIYIYSENGITAQYAEFALISVAVFFIIWLLLSLLSFFLAKIAYHPIDELNAFAARYSGAADISNEITHISSAIKGMEEKINLLSEESVKNKKLLRERFIKDLLSGVISEESYFETADSFSCADYENPFYAGVFEISDYTSLVEAFGEKQIADIKKQILSFINNELMGRSVHDAFETDKKRFAVITYGCPLSKIRQNFSYIVSVVNSEFDVEMFAAIGSECDSLANISESYTNCVKSLDDSAVLGFRSTVIVFDDIKTTTSGFYYPVNLERDLIASVMRLKREECSRIINDILDENLNGKTLTKEKHNAIIFAFTATINRIVDAINKTTSEVFGEDNIIFLELKMCTDAGALRAKIIQSFEHIISYMSGSSDADMSSRLIDYIHSHYNEDISLTEIGEYFGRSKCYISTVFKETTGENFKDYLSRYRIKKAKEILTKNPNIKTKELASMIGCNTVATLFRLFNKYENMSPGQFVKNNK